MREWKYIGLVVTLMAALNIGYAHSEVEDGAEKEEHKHHCDHDHGAHKHDHAAHKHQLDKKEKSRNSVLEKYDVNKDGELDEEERTAFKNDRKQNKEDRHKKYLEKYDVDGDGELNKEEHEAIRSAAKERRDNFKEERLKAKKIRKAEKAANTEADTQE